MNRSWMKEFFAEDHKILILPFAEDSELSTARLQNCQNLFQGIGLSTFKIACSMTYRDTFKCSLLFAADTYRLYESNFLITLLELFLPHTAGHISFLRLKDEELRKHRDKTDSFITQVLRMAGEDFKISQIERSPFCSKKLKVIIDVIKRTPGITFTLEESEIKIELEQVGAPSLSTWRGLYLNAEAFIQSALESGALPLDAPEVKAPKPVRSLWIDAEGIYCSVGSSVDNLAAGEIARRAFLDAGLPCGIGPKGSPEVFAFRDDGRKPVNFYWKLLTSLYKTLPLSYASISRGYTEALSYTDIRRQDVPLPGLTGLSRFQILNNALHNNQINFDEYLGLAGEAICLRELQAKQAFFALHELLAEEDFLVACLPFRLAAGEQFPARDLVTLCCDSPSVMAQNETGAFRIYFPHYFGTPAISRENYLNLMIMLAMLLNQHFLLVQNGAGVLFRINTDVDSECLGEIEKAGTGPVHDSAWWQATLTRLTDLQWRFQEGSTKGQRLRFIPGTFLNHANADARTRARKRILSGAKKLGSEYGLTGRAANVLLHGKDDSEYLFYRDFMAASEKRLPQSFFEGGSVLYMEVSSLDAAGKRALAEKFALKGCLVCMVNARASLLAKPLFPPRAFMHYWQWLQEDNLEFVGISLGCAWHIPANTEIDEIWEPLGWDGRYVS